MTPPEFSKAFRHLRNGNSIDRSAILSAREWIINTARSAQGDPVVCGTAASIMLGTEWYDDDFTIELIRQPTCSGRPAEGSVTRRVDLDAADIVMIDGIKVTSPLRTAFDLLRIKPAWRALGYVSMLARAVEIDPKELLRYAQRQRHVRHVVQARELALLVDKRAESPPECWVAHLMFKAELPTPDVQIKVADESGWVFAKIDLGYEALRIGIEYDGEDFHSTPEQQAHDEERQAKLEELGWIIIRVDKKRLREDPFGVVVEINTALRARGAY